MDGSHALFLSVGIIIGIGIGSLLTLLLSV